MKRNMDRTLGLIYSQRVMLSLIDSGLSREEAYDIVQPRAMESWEKQVSFKSIVESDERISNALTKQEIDDCFDYSYHIRNVDIIFEKLGLQ